MQDIEAGAAVNALDVDLLVVGAGPVGMTAALAAAARGLRVAIVERRTGTSDEPKAISLDDESLRLYQAAGVVDQVLGIVVPGTGTAYYDADGQLLFRAGTGEPCRHGYPFKNPFAQPDLERVLYEAMVADAGIAVHFSSELVGLEQGQDAAHARLETPAGTLDIDASYVIAADGGRSTVRQLFDISMAGRSFEDVWLVVDTVGDVRRERYGMHHGEPSRPHVIVPGLHGRCRYEFYLSPAEAAEVNDEPGFELIKRLVAPYRAISPEEVERAVAYRFHALNATRWRVGRVFLAGDAAHMMPPFAGQGLNSGLRDVANLVWKIDEAIRKPRSEEFLDSYQAERYPHASAVIASSVRLGRVVMTTSDRLARLRDKTIRRALATEDGREFFLGFELVGGQAQGGEVGDVGDGDGDTVRVLGAVVVLGGEQEQLGVGGVVGVLVAGFGEAFLDAGFQLLGQGGVFAQDGEAVARLVGGGGDAGGEEQEGGEDGAEQAHGVPGRWVMWGCAAAYHPRRALLI